MDWSSRVDVEPTAADLRVIEDEWPLIEAELEVVDAEIVAARCGDGMPELVARRLRRATARLNRVIAEQHRQAAETFGGAA